MSYFFFLSFLLFAFQALAGLCEKTAFSEPKVGIRVNKVELRAKPSHPLPSRTSLEEQINYTFQNQDLKRQIFTRISLKTGTPEGERLEFLGDAVWGVFILDLMLTRFPKFGQNERLSSYRWLTSNQLQAQLAFSLDFHKLLILPFDTSKWSLESQMLLSQLIKTPLSTKSGIKTLADVLEALVGAVYVDGGYRSTQRLMERFLNLIINKPVWYGVHGKDLTVNDQPSLTNQSILTTIDPSKTKLLGSTVLTMILTEILFDHYDTKTPKSLTQIRSPLYAIITQKLGEHNDVKSRLKNWGVEISHPYYNYNEILSVIFLGAQYLMEGYSATKNTVEKIAIEEINK